MKVLPDDWKRDYRTIYEILYDTPRILPKGIEKVLGTTAGQRLIEAIELLIIVGPYLRKRSFRNLKQYMYFLICKNPVEEFLRLREDMNVVYHAKTLGFCNLWVVSREKIDIDGEIVAEGYCSDYHVPFAPDRISSTAIRIMREKGEIFDPEEYQPRGIIRTHFDETTKWDEKDERLFRSFKCGLRITLDPLIKEHRISETTLYQFLERLPEICTIATGYFPDTLPAYEPYLYMLETDYEDFLIEFFSELPTTTTFFKVSDKLIAFIYVPKQVVIPDPNVYVSKLDIPVLVNDLQRRGIIKKYAECNISCFRSKDF